jgi:flagellar protein FliJ
MKKFRFRLQTLEDLKGMELDGLRQQLAERQTAVRAAEQKLLATRDALNDSYTELARLREAGAYNPAALLSLEAYTVLLRDQLRAQAQHVMQLRREMEAARQALLAKHKEKKVLEKYRERQYEKYSQTTLGEQQKELDETASNVYQQHQR